MPVLGHFKTEAHQRYEMLQISTYRHLLKFIVVKQNIHKSFSICELNFTIYNLFLSQDLNMESSNLRSLLSSFALNN